MTFDTCKGEVKYLEVVSPLPPVLFCQRMSANSSSNETSNTSSECRVLVEATFEQSSKDYKCYKSKSTVPQAVLQSDQSNTVLCGREISATGWAQPIRIPVKGLIDTLRGRRTDAVRMLSLYEKHMDGKVQTKRRKIGQVKVCRSAGVLLVLEVLQST